MNTMLYKAKEFYYSSVIQDNANDTRLLFRSIDKLLQRHEGVISKETVVLRRWGSSIQKFGFINGVDNVNWPPYRDSKS